MAGLHILKHEAAFDRSSVVRHVSATDGVDDSLITHFDSTQHGTWRCCKRAHHMIKKMMSKRYDGACTMGPAEIPLCFLARSCSIANA